MGRMSAWLGQISWSLLRLPICLFTVHLSNSENWLTPPKPLFLGFSYGLKQSPYLCFSRFPALAIHLPPEMLLWATWHYLICLQHLPRMYHIGIIHSAHIYIYQHDSQTCSFESKTSCYMLFLRAVSFQHSSLEAFSTTNCQQGCPSWPILADWFLST